MDQLGAGPEPPLRIRVDAEVGGTVVVSAAGELDMATIDRLDEAVQAVITTEHRKLILDLSEVSFADSSAIAKLVQWNAAAAALEIRGASELLRRVIASMGLADSLNLT